MSDLLGPIVVTALSLAILVISVALWIVVRWRGRDRREIRQLKWLLHEARRAARKPVPPAMADAYRSRPAPSRTDTTAAVPTIAPPVRRVPQPPPPATTPLTPVIGDQLSRAFPTIAAGIWAGSDTP